jgi:hypothetical protein
MSRLRVLARPTFAVCGIARSKAVLRFSVEVAILDRMRSLGVSELRVRLERDSRGPTGGLWRVHRLAAAAAGPARTDRRGNLAAIGRGALRE